MTLMILSLLGCAGVGGGADTGSTDDTAGGGGTLYTAQEGAWTLATASIVLDECDLGSQMASGGEEPMTLALTDEGADLTFDDGDPWVCTQAGNTLSCVEQETEETDLTGDGVDVLISGSISLSGTLTETTAMNLSLSAARRCEGTDCDAYASVEGLTLPCTTTLSSTATAD
jgi:hypothetical protein